MNEKMHRSHREEMLVTLHLQHSWKRCKNVSGSGLLSPQAAFMVGSVSPRSGCQAQSNSSTAGSQVNRFPHACPVQRGRFPAAHSFTENRLISRVGESAVNLTVHRESWASVSASHPVPSQWPITPMTLGPKNRSQKTYFMKG